MFGNIQAGSSGDSGNAFQLNFIVSCKETDACKDALAVTDAAPITESFTPILRLCPLFFTDPRTANFLTSKDLIRNPGRRDNSWCQPGQPFSFFETAGHTFLHEMTHLDQLGSQSSPLSQVSLYTVLIVLILQKPPVSASATQQTKTLKLMARMISMPSQAVTIPLAPSGLLAN